LERGICEVHGDGMAERCDFMQREASDIRRDRAWESLFEEGRVYCVSLDGCRRVYMIHVPGFRRHQGRRRSVFMLIPGRIAECLLPSWEECLLDWERHLYRRGPSVILP
jgi:hypothetical protein